MCVRCGSSRCGVVYGLILLLLQSNWAVSKILDEETGQCRYTLYSMQLFFSSAVWSHCVFKLRAVKWACIINLFRNIQLRLFILFQSMHTFYTL